MLSGFKQKHHLLTASGGKAAQHSAGNMSIASGRRGRLPFNYHSVVVSLVVLSLLVQGAGFSFNATPVVANAQATTINTPSQSGPVIARQIGSTSETVTAIKPRIAFSKTYFANLTSDTTTGTPTSCTTLGNTDCSFRSALGYTATDGHTNPDLIILTSGATYTLTSTLPTIGTTTANIPNVVYISSAAAYSTAGASFPFTCPTVTSAATIKGATAITGLVLGSNDYLVNLSLSNFTGDGLTLLGNNNTLTCSTVSDNSNNGITINSSGNKVGGIFGASNAGLLGNGAEILVSNNGGNGIQITGSTAVNNKVQDSDVVTNSLTGIVITATASSNLIGSNNAAYYNQISNNSRGGLSIGGTGTNANNVQGNLIGTNPAGTIGIGNGTGAGIVIANGASNNIVGGASGNANLISFNQVGIVLDNANSNKIQGNLVGVNGNGTSALANVTDGVRISNGASNNTIGGGVGLNNTISGNAGNGILVSGDGSNGNTIENNLIGTNSAGSLAIANKNGVALLDGPANTIIGGTGPNQFNLINGNSSAGISLTGAITNTLITRNDIGTNASGDYLGITPGNVNLANGVGIALSSDATGGPNQSVISQNVVAFNTNEAIQIGIGSGTSEAVTSKNQVSQNSIYSNAGGLGIALNGGANNNITAPIIASGVITPVNHTFKVSGKAVNSSTVEVFLGSIAGTSSYQGITYFGTTTADSSTGDFVISGTLPAGFVVPANPKLVATNTAAGNTSQFSLPFAPFVISNIKATPYSLNFSYTQGGSNPAVQSANTTLTALLAASNVSSTVSYANGAGWLNLTPSSDNLNIQVNTPVVVTITVNATNLSPSSSPYVAIVSFTDNANPFNVATITVTLNVLAAPPTTTPTPTSPSPTPTPTPTPTPPPGNTVYTYYLPFLANNAGGFNTYLAFQNTGTATANVSLQYFDTSGATVTTPATTCQTVVQNGECIADNPFGTNAKGSGILTSDQPLNVVVSEATPLGGTAYTISTVANNSLVAPFAINGNNNFITQLNLFNAGATSVTATVQFYSITGTLQTTATQRVTIGAHQNLTLDQAATTGGNPSNLPTGFYGWAQITGATGSQLVGQVLEQNTASHFVAIANAQAIPQSTLYAPAIFNQGYSVFTTGSNIVNPNSTPVTVSITYYNLNGTATNTAPFVIPAFAIQPIYQGGTSGPGLPIGGLPLTFTGAATITSVGGGLVVAVNEAGAATATTVQSGTYLAAAQGSNKVSLPAVANGGFGGFISGVTIFNVSSSTVTATVQYYSYVNNSNNGTPVGTAKTYVIAANASQGVYQGNVGLPTDFYGTAVVAVSSGPANALLVTTNQQSPNFFYTYIEPAQ